MQKAFEPEGSRAFIPTISLVALSCGDAKTVSGGTRQHQNASSKASFRYSHSVTGVAGQKLIDFSTSSQPADSMRIDGPHLVLAPLMHQRATESGSH